MGGLLSIHVSLIELLVMMNLREYFYNSSLTTGFRCVCVCESIY
jgi:hypothetical protein